MGKRERLETNINHEYYDNIHEYRIEKLDIKVLTRTAAFVVGKYTHKLTDKTSHTSNSSAVFTWVFEKQNDNWKIIHFHVSESDSED